MTTTSDARKRLAENRNTAHPAPTPAPDAVLTEAIAAGTIQVGDLSDDGVLLGPGFFEAGPNAPEWARRAAAEFPRPEPVVAPPPSEAVLDEVRYRMRTAVAYGLLRGKHGEKADLQWVEGEIAGMVERFRTLFPEDDEDAVRVPKEAVEALRRAHPARPGRDMAPVDHFLRAAVNDR